MSEHDIKWRYVLEPLIKKQALMKDAPLKDADHSY